MNKIKWRAYILAFGAALALSACVDVKIAATLPQNQYFSLQKIDSQSNSVSCKGNRGRIGIFDIQANAPYDGTALITYNATSLQISELSGKKWINSPKEMFKTSLLQALNQSCFQSSIAPFGTQKLSKILKITILSLQVVKESNASKAQLSVFYEIFDSRNYARSGIITKELALNADIQSDTSSESLAQSFVRLNDEVIGEIIKKL